MTPPTFESTTPDPCALVAICITAAVLVFGLALACLWMIERAFV